MNFLEFSTLHWEGYRNRYSDILKSFTFPHTDEKIGISSLRTASAVYSSNIEGNTLDLNSFLNAKHFTKQFPQKKEEEEIENLIAAYRFAEQSKLNEQHFLKAHSFCSKTLLPHSQQGTYRNQKVGVFGKEGLIYIAVEHEYVEKQMVRLFQDIEEYFQSQKTDVANIFFFASYIHLRFVHIHPFMDGNGRMARILEKWIIAEVLGENAWTLQNEEIYKNHRSQYYEAINIGVNFYELDYSKAFDFVTILPENL